VRRLDLVFRVGYHVKTVAEDAAPAAAHGKMSVELLHERRLLCFACVHVDEPAGRLIQLGKDMESGPTYDFETGMYRPPSEGGSHSLLVRFTRNCPWNRCGFCGMYKAEKFQLRTVEEIKRDIDAMAALCRELQDISGGVPTRAALAVLVQRNPGLRYHHGVDMLYHWLVSGARTAFLQDANSLIMKTSRLVEVLTYLRRGFRSIERVTTYARARTVALKSREELADIRGAGLDRLHLGLESGDDAVLKMVRKGVTADGHVKAGRKALAAGFQVSEYWMPGLGGVDMWERHAENTARVLNEINPHYIRSRPFYPWPGTPMGDAFERGAFRMLSGAGQLIELRRTVELLTVSSRVCFDHAGNFWKDRCGRLLFSHDYEGYKFPEEKQRVLERIEDGLSVGAGNG